MLQTDAQTRDVEQRIANAPAALLERTWPERGGVPSASKTQKCAYPETIKTGVRWEALYMNHRFGSERDLDLLAEWNHQLIRDEGHRNPMSIGQLRERMKGWLEGDYRVVVFGMGSDLVAYALYREAQGEIYLRQFFVERGHRRQGIGKEAVRILRERIWPADRRLTVEVLAANAPGAAFWRSAGYAEYCLTLEIVPKGIGEEEHARDTSLSQGAIRRMTKTIPYPLELTTERLVIRSPSQEAAEGLRAGIEESLDELRPWMPWADHALTPAEAEENCSNAAQRFKDGTDHRLHFFLKDSNLFLGGSGLHRIDWSVPSVEIGYWIRSSQTGNGYVSEAVDAIARYAFDELSAKRVVIIASADNEKSWRVAERLGFALEGTLRNDHRNTDGRLRDTRIYAKTAEDDGRTTAST